MNIIFDFDGTICDSFDVSLLILNKYLLDHHLPEVTKSELRDGGFKALVKKRHVPLILIPKIVMYGRKEIKKYIQTLKTFPGMTQVLQTISGHNFMAITTSNSKENVETFLKNNHINGIFKEVNTDFSMFGKQKKINSIIKKHNLKRDETFYIGDETRDVEAAKKAHVKSAAVTWGFETEESLSKSKPDFVIESPSQLAGILQKFE